MRCGAILQRQEGNLKPLNFLMHVLNNVFFISWNNWPIVYKLFYQERVLEMYNMLVGISSEIERIKEEIAKRK